MNGVMNSEHRMSWRNHYRRICTWARLIDRQTSRSFYVYNTHLDHQSPLARGNGVRLIMQTIASRPSADPFVLCGDFNASEDSKIIAYLKGVEPLETPSPIALVDSWRVMHPENSDCGTASHFIGSREPLKIDYIMTTPNTRVLASEILRVDRDGRHPSDHYPVTALLRLE